MGTVSGRYEIFDILSQDADGVVFHAEDRQTGAEVALRRFFPFGAGGGGLEGEERTAYEIAVRRLIGIAHPALRNVIDGGIDPVDGMPFLVTEWLEGEQLSKRLAERPLSPASAKSLAQFALDACQLLSELFQEEAVWIETAADTIILVAQDQNRPITFWISPLRWLGQSRERHGLGSLLQLVEEATGWRGCVVQDSAGDGLGAWVKALRKDPFRWNLAEARAALEDPLSFTRAEMVPQGTSADPPTIRPLSPAAPTIRPPLPRIPVAPPRSPRWPWFVAALLTVAAGTFVFLQAKKPDQPPPAAILASGKPADRQPETPANPTAAAEDRTLSPAEIASARAAQLASGKADTPATPPTGTAGFASEELNRRLIEIGTSLRGSLGETAEFEGRVLRVRASNSGKTLYLEFGSSVEPNALCARHMPQDIDAARGTFDALAGKNVRIRGIVVADPSGRIAINLESIEAVTVLDP